ncbi:MAG: type II secretion system protein [Candidatus Paceibacterota bacterium]|jgi:prepilin-type N-terminal cleavage/methylation domain-containing protein
MDYQAKYNKKWGFTLIELLIVIGIFLLVMGVSTSTYSSFKSHNGLEIATGGVVEAIRLAQASAQSGKGDAKWGVKILPSGVTVFKGDSYASRDTTADQPLDFSGGITVDGLSEFVFEKLTGVTIMIGTTTLSNGAQTKEININAKGTVTY